MISLKELKETVKYDPLTGAFIWLVYKRRSGKQIGERADILHKKGYMQLGINNKTYVAHRVAWFYMTGEWPKNEIAHKNRIRNDNRWENLREATKSQNMYNRVAANNTGVKGVYKLKNGKFRVLIQLGTFDNLEKASKVYNEAAKKLQGEFAITQ